MSLKKILAAMLPVLALIAVAWFYGKGDQDALVVYCAHDSVYSQQILERFQQETGLKVRMRFDSEATKSLGLVERLVREGDQGPCDVFWNNEILGTLDLAEKGLLAPYQGSGWQRIPDSFKDAEGLWCGFAARMRVWLHHPEVNADEVIQLPEPDPGQVAMAKPLYGTTRTHYTFLWQQWGGEKLQSWHHGLRQRGLKEVSGNGASMRKVAEGAVRAGWTDTDDSFVALDEQKPVQMTPCRLPQGQTIVIPNTVSIMKGSQRRQAAERLVDFLLSEEIELALAAGRARQIPLGTVDEAQVPKDVQQLRQWATEGADLKLLTTARTPCLEWLKSEYRQ